MSWFPGEGIPHFTEIFLAQKWNSYIPWSWNRAGWGTRKWQGGKISIGVERIICFRWEGDVSGGREAWIIDYLQDKFGKTDLLPLRTALLTEPWIALGRWTLAVKRFPPGVGSHRGGTLPTRSASLWVHAAFRCTKSIAGLKPRFTRLSRQLYIIKY